MVVVLKATTVDTEGTAAGRLWRLAYPVIGLNLLSVLSLAVDTAMCGRLPDAEPVLEGLGFAVQIVFLAMVAMMGLVVGTVALVARAYGARNAERVNHILAQSTQLTVAVSFAVAVLGNVLAEPLVRVMGAEGAAVTEAVRYLRPALGGCVFFYLIIMYAGVLRGVGNTRLPFVIALGTNALNIALNYCLILGNLGFPALGVQGAAIGTVASFAVGVIAYVVLLRRDTQPGVFLPLSPRALDRGLARQLYRVGWPAALDMIILNAGFMSIIGMLGRIDGTAVAAHGIGLRLQALAFVPGLAVSQATGALVGQALGGGDPEEARRVARAAMVICTAIMTTLAIAIIFAARPIVALFDVTAGSALETYTVTWIRLLGYCMPPVGVHIALAGLLQGSGATNTSLGINTIGTIGLQIPLAVLLGYGLDLGAAGVWASFPLSFIAKAALAYAAYRRGRWARTGERL